MLEILFVEDNAADIQLTAECLSRSKVSNHLSVVEDGVDALAFLRQEGLYHQSPLPDLILLDINLSRKDGWEVLAEIKSDPHFKRIPVIILTSSDAQADIIKAYDLYANCYITKPIGFEEFNRAIHSIEAFWCHIAKLPAREASISSKR